MDEAARHKLYDAARSTFGEEAASTLMAQLPPYDWPDMATRADVAELRADLKADVGAVRTEIRDVETRLLDQLAGKADVERTVREAITGQTRMMLFGNVASIVTTGSLVLAATQL